LVLGISFRTDQLIYVRQQFLLRAEELVKSFRSIGERWTRIKCRFPILDAHHASNDASMVVGAKRDRVLVPSTSAASQDVVNVCLAENA
jgi:hypothetical protein